MQRRRGIRFFVYGTKKTSILKFLNIRFFVPFFARSFKRFFGSSIEKINKQLIVNCKNNNTNHRAIIT